MKENHNAQISKILILISAIASLSNIALLTTMIVRGFEGVTSAVSQYLLRKYGTNVNAGNQRRYGLLSISLFCLVTQNILIFRAFKKQQERKIAEMNTIKIAFILISISIMCQIPTFGFYISLFVQMKHRFESVSVKIVIILQSVISLTGSLTSWGLLLKFCYKHDEKIDNSLENSEQMKNRDAQGEMEDNRYRENVFTSKPILQPLFYGKFGQKIRREKQREKQFQGELPIFHSTAQQGNFPQENFINNSLFKNNSYIKSKTKPSKKQKREQEQQLQRKLLKAEIQHKKKRFREIFDQKHFKQQGEADQSSYESVDDPYKLRNLPKTYRQYIKQAKRPQRTIDAKNYLYPPSIQNKLGNKIEEPKIKKEDIMKRIRDLNLQNNLAENEELVYLKKLKAKQPKKKILFQDDFICLNKFNEPSQPSDPNELSRYRKPKTAQQLLLMRLKARYIFQEQRENDNL